MKQINLYQADFRPPQIVLPARALLRAGAVFLLGLVALYGWETWQLGQLRSEIEQATQRAGAVSNQVQAYARKSDPADSNLAAEALNLETRARSLQLAQEAVASGELGSASGYSVQFRALARAAGNSANPGAWLTGVTIFDNGRALDLHGRALTGADSARLIASLRREPIFVGLTFASLNVATPEGARTDAQPPSAARFLEFSLNARPAESPQTGARQTARAEAP